MKLKVKFLKWSAGRPVAILHKKFAENLGIHVDDRILIRKDSRKIIAVVDLAVSMFEKADIAVSTEVIESLNLKGGDVVEVEIAPKPESISIISKKLGGKTLSQEELENIMSDIVKNALTESEIAYFVSAIYNCNMRLPEIERMTQAIVETGKKLNFHKKIVVDKHSIGGIPGRTTPIVVSICAAAGLTMPKTSSRAITSPSGTADALEVICKVDFSLAEIKRIINKTNACMVWGGSLGLAPADDKIIQVERLMNIDPEAQLLASIMAKKISVGSKYVLIEIPFGVHAKVNKKQALKLKGKFEKIGKSFKIKVKCILIKTEEPLGNGLGPALEIKDVISVLKRESSCHLLEERAVFLAAQILELAGKVKKGKGIKLARGILDSGRAWKKFQQIILAQGGKINGIKEARLNHNLLAEKDSTIKEIDVKALNQLARILGCPADKYSGIYIHKHLHQKVKKSEVILTLYSDSETELKEGIRFYNKNKPIKLK